MFPVKRNKEVVDLYIINSVRIRALAEKSEGSSTRIPWEERKDSLTFVGHRLPRFDDACPLSGLNLFVNTRFNRTSVDPGFVLRVDRCSPGVRCGCPPEATEDVGIPYGFFEFVFEYLGCQDYERPERVEFCEGSIIVRSASVPS